MRKVALLFVCVILLFMLVGCSYGGKMGRLPREVKRPQTWIERIERRTTSAIE